LLRFATPPYRSLAVRLCADRRVNLGLGLLLTGFFVARFGGDHRVIDGEGLGHLAPDCPQDRGIGDSAEVVRDVERLADVFPEKGQDMLRHLVDHDAGIVSPHDHRGQEVQVVDALAVDLEGELAMVLPEGRLVERDLTAQAIQAQGLLDRDRRLALEGFLLGQQELVCLGGLEAANAVLPEVQEVVELLLLELMADVEALPVGERRNGDFNSHVDHLADPFLDLPVALDRAHVALAELHHHHTGGFVQRLAVVAQLRFPITVRAGNPPRQVEQAHSAPGLHRCGEVGVGSFLHRPGVLVDSLGLIEDEAEFGDPCAELTEETVGHSPVVGHVVALSSESDVALPVITDEDSLALEVKEHFPGLADVATEVVGDDGIHEGNHGTAPGDWLAPESQVACELLVDVGVGHGGFLFRQALGDFASQVIISTTVDLGHGIPAGSHSSRDLAGETLHFLAQLHRVVADCGEVGLLEAFHRELRGGLTLCDVPTLRSDHVALQFTESNRSLIFLAHRIPLGCMYFSTRSCCCV